MVKKTKTDKNIKKMIISHNFEHTSLPFLTIEEKKQQQLGTQLYVALL